jgi:hypothetical protein
MKSAVSAAILVLVIGGGAAGGYLLAKHNAAAAEASAPLPQRAMDAYQAGRYADAVPLLKSWAKTMTVKNDGPQLGKVLTYLADAESKVSGKPVATSEGAAGPIGGVAAVVPATQQATVATGDGPVILDPSTNKPRVPHAPPVPGQVLTMSIKELANFEFDPNGNSPIPADVKALDGAKFRLRGFMIPMNQAEQITDFSLVPSLVGCCFGQPPGVQHTITCRTLKGTAIDYTVDEIMVEGTLKLDVKRDEGYAYNVFDLEVSGAKPAE